MGFVCSRQLEGGAGLCLSLHPTPGRTALPLSHFHFIDFSLKSTPIYSGKIVYASCEWVCHMKDWGTWLSLSYVPFWWEEPLSTFKLILRHVDQTWGQTGCALWQDLNPGLLSPATHSSSCQLSGLASGGGELMPLECRLLICITGIISTSHTIFVRIYEMIVYSQ